MRNEDKKESRVCNVGKDPCQVGGWWPQRKAAAAAAAPSSLVLPLPTYHTYVPTYIHRFIDVHCFHSLYSSQGALNSSKGK